MSLSVPTYDSVRKRRIYTILPLLMIKLTIVFRLTPNSKRHVQFHIN